MFRSKIFKYFVRVRRPKKKISASRRQQIETARALVATKLIEWNTLYQFSYGRVFIKNQKTRWGSCSSKRNLNFNYKIIHLPPHLVDYLIVHELCHLEQMNHGPMFWALVARALPNYAELRAELHAFPMPR